VESESFNYLSVLLAIVLGLAVTQVLQGLRGLILTRARVKLYLPTLIWAGLMLLLAIQGWWASFAMRTRPHWTFLALLVIDAQVLRDHLFLQTRIPIEERILRKGLPGFNDYAAQVRYRLVPRVW
jgi:hypothetical protein